MAKNRTINVQGYEIAISQVNQEDYICITDMAKTRNGDSRAIDIIKNWLRNRNTIEFLGGWETLYNPDFKVEIFDHFRKQAGLNSFVLNPQVWIEETSAKGIISKSGRYGGTFAHKDIAFEFGTWLSPSFKLYLIKEFQRLKETESPGSQLEWNFRRSLAATNYRIHTDAIKENLIPWGDIPQNADVYIYAEEADLINLALFGITIRQWREKYPNEASQGKNIRDCADSNRLIVLSNLESLNAMLIREKVDKKKRFELLRKTAISQLESLNKIRTAIPAVFEIPEGKE